MALPRAVTASGPCRALGTGGLWHSQYGNNSRLEAIQNKINEWEGADAGQYQIVPFDLSVFPEIVNQR